MMALDLEAFLEPFFSPPFVKVTGISGLDI